ncbi:hypothetical protein NDS46_31705 (plasmid) [Paenibacillus thiaminolyticus]|uniref:hypothetical protein n=1 Tax=Paenibacillus thiaminolyticus TaxID=49283 RepID=UPI00233130AE|nr:hypothetical protein [Paenibacillus thiaminolyticus]WCF11525.1 hypothetical protein NDS46_31705 [Paenibacillus thiaminolyticus]
MMYQDRLNNQETVTKITAELKVKGFYSILNKQFTEDDANMLYLTLIRYFPNVLYLELNQEKKFFIVSKIGKKSVLKLIESSIFNLKRKWVTLEQKKQPFEEYYKEWEDLIKSKKVVEGHRF